MVFYRNLNNFRFSLVNHCYRSLGGASKKRSSLVSFFFHHFLKGSRTTVFFAIMLIIIVHLFMSFIVRLGKLAHLPTMLYNKRCTAQEYSTFWSRWRSRDSHIDRDRQAGNGGRIVQNMTPTRNRRPNPALDPPVR